MISIRDRLLAGLTSIYNSSKDSNVGKLITIISEQIDDIYREKERVVESRDIESAFGKTLDYIGEGLQQKRGSLEDSQYRLLIKSKAVRNRATGDINSLLEVMSTLLKIPIQEVKLEENGGGEVASIYIEVPMSAIGKYNISLDQFVVILNRITSAGVRAYTMLGGTFEFGDANNLAYDADCGLGDVNNNTIGGGLGSWYQSVDIA